MGTTIRFATRQDTLKILAYLHEAQLATEGVAEAIEYFLVMEDEKGAILATLGFEANGSAGLLRSLAMSPKLNEADLLSLFQQMYLLAKEKKLTTLYLATNKPSSVAFFRSLGFRELETNDIPKALTDFQHIKNISAVDNSIIMENKL
jgi:N-acetylglutamate synthase-like GNAT family acetyltransferase